MKRFLFTSRPKFPGFYGKIDPPKPTPKPTDPAYFTGNSNYYQFLMALNEMIRTKGLDFESTPQADQTKWKDKTEMIDKLEMRLDDKKYNELLFRLNLLDPFSDQDPLVRRLLQPFFKESKALISAPPMQYTLDELGRAHTLASRKTAKAQAWTVPGDGSVYVNGVHLSDYFELRYANKVIEPFEKTDTLGKFNTWTIVKGGGLRSQADAISIAIARGVALLDEKCKVILDEEEMTKIPIIQKERKKTGQPKARKKHAWVKR